MKIVDTNSLIASAIYGSTMDEFFFFIYTFNKKYVTIEFKMIYNEIEKFKITYWESEMEMIKNIVWTSYIIECINDIELKERIKKYAKSN